LRGSIDSAKRAVSDLGGDFVAIHENIADDGDDGGLPTLLLLDCLRRYDQVLNDHSFILASQNQQEGCYVFVCTSYGTTKVFPPQK